MYSAGLPRSAGGYPLLPPPGWSALYDVSLFRSSFNTAAQRAACPLDILKLGRTQKMQHPPKFLGFRAVSRKTGKKQAQRVQRPPVAFFSELVKAALDVLTLCFFGTPVERTNFVMVRRIWSFLVRDHHHYVLPLRCLLLMKSVTELDKVT